MRLLGFNLNKISAEKHPNSSADVKIVPNVNIEDIKDVKSEGPKTKEEFIGVKFSYTINYEPGYAKLEFSGELLASVDSKVAKEVTKNWKDKKLEGDFKVFLFNVILRRTNVKALELEDDLNLPLHVPLPSVNKESFKPSSEKQPRKE